MANYSSSHTGAEIDSAVGRLKSTAVTAGTVAASSGVCVDSNKDITGFRNITLTGQLTAATISLTGDTDIGDAAGDTVTITAQVDSNVVPSADNTYDLGSSTKEWKDIYIDGTAYLDAINFNGTAITSTAAELNILDGVTSTAAELNILDGVTSTATELNIMDGGTSATSTTLADADRVVVNDGGTMKQVALTDFETYFESALDTLSNVTSVGTIGTGTWQGTKVASAYLDDDTAHLSGTQTFSGAKTFTGGLTIDTSADNYVTMTSGATDANLGFLFKNSSDVQKGYILFDSDDHILTLDSADRILFKTNSAERMRITSGGELYIGTANEGLSINGNTSGAGTITGINQALSAYKKLVFNASEHSWKISGSEKMVIDTSGNVGIGTTAPENKLTVVQTENATETNITQDSDTWGVLVETGNYTAARFVGMIAHRNANKEAQTGIWSEITSSGSLMHLGTSADYDTGVNVKNMTLKYDGNVGIGTTSPDGILHTAKSNARNDVYFDTYDLGTEYSALWFRRSNSDTVGTKAQTDDGDILGSIYFQGVDTGSNFDYGAFITATQSGSAGARVPSILTFGTSDGTNIPERMRIDSSGNVGIGTTSPDQILHCKVASGDPSIVCETESGGGARLKLIGTDNNMSIQSSGGLNFYTGASTTLNGTERMRLTSGGALQVGDFSSASHFQVKASYANEYIARIHNDGDGEQYYGLWIQCGHDNASDQNFAITIADGDGGEQGYVTFSGGTVAYGPFTANHDAELPDSDNGNGYPYGTLVETTEIFYKQKNDQDTERGILYKVKKSSSAYSKKVLGAYSSKFPTDMYENQHQIYVLGDGHILCNGEKGNIEIGDGICSSSTEGEGMKADQTTMIIGIAQEDVSFSGSESKLVVVQYGLQQFTPWENA